MYSTSTSCLTTFSVNRTMPLCTYIIFPGSIAITTTNIPRKTKNGESNLMDPFS